MLEKKLGSLRAALNSSKASLVYTVLACLTVSLSIENYAIPLFILWVLLVLLLDASFLNIFLPVTLLCGFAIRTAGQSAMLLNHLWLAIPVVAVITVHFILYGKRRKLRMLFPQLAISAALLLGGVFRISPENYFKPDALYYVFFLGLGMVFFYVWFRSGVCSNEFYDVREKLMECLFCLGIFCTYSIFDQALRLFLATGKPLGAYLWSNDICELMLFCIPAAFYYARKRYGFVAFGFLFYGSMVLTQSLSALLAGGVLLVVCLVYLLFYRKTLRALTAVLLGCLCVGAISAFAFLTWKSGGLAALFSKEENGRLALIKNAWQGFLSSPIFGVGIGQPSGYVGFMSIDWTHNFIFQILGSMGIIGVLAYGYQLYERGKLIFSHPDPFRLAAGLSYLGLFLISMLQPGEFCPMPYAMMAVMIFTVLEVSEEERLEKQKSEEKTAISS